MKSLPVVCLLVCGALSNAQSTRPEDIAQGSILIMQRDTPDPIFSHSVIVLAKHEKGGSVGLMIHHRSDIPIQKALRGLPGADKRSDAMFIGGPVELEGVMALLRSDSAPPNTTPVTGKLYLAVSKEGVADALAARKASDVRVYLGYAGWAPGQLAGEVRRGGWWIFGYDESLIFDEHPETLWQRLIKRTELQRVSLPFLQAAAFRKTVSIR